jgi:hypothetical protein
MPFKKRLQNQPRAEGRVEQAFRPAYAARHLMGFSPRGKYLRRLKPHNSEALNAALKRCSTQNQSPDPNQNPSSNARYLWHVEQLVMSVTVRSLYFFTRSLPSEI